jgi:curved DNA-binding protein CbpA
VPLREAKAAYKKMALRYHPDKVAARAASAEGGTTGADADELNPKAAQTKMAEINQAWEALQKLYKNVEEDEEHGEL